MSRRILLCVDDRPQLLQVRKAQLERLGFAVLTATNAVTAVAVLQQAEVSAVLLEYKLEGLDAEAVAFHIKQRFPTKPVLLLSAYSDMPERILWLVDEYVMKSDPLQRLVKTVKRLTHSPESKGGQRHNGPICLARFHTGVGLTPPMSTRTDIRLTRIGRTCRASDRKLDTSEPRCPNC